ncbi:BspA family leucine-rich repeat surface protein [Ellagibacter isourolithinifaciens]|uniref:BspA family leucine-rich repeat surface protein n=1 Tax=Ellagibacter isourolithinifaciens TaxID=2137581 RepID=UPI003A8E3D80
MSVSAKPTEKVFKSFLAAVLAISLCPLMPAEKAQAEEAGDSGEPADAAQVSDEGKGGGADPTDGALAADGSDADSELAGENYGAEDEGAPDDSNVAMQAASDSGAPIVDWTECGTCQWMIDSSGCLIIEPQSGESGELENWVWTAPWSNYKNSIISATIKKTVIAKTASRAFYDCKSLRSVDLSGLDTSKVTSMYCMFQGCSSLASLDLSSFDTSKVTDMSGMFSGCSSLKSLNVTSFDTCKVTSMSAMFNSCTSLESLDLSSFNASSVTTMMVMFGNCPSLKSLTFSSRLDTSNVKSMRLLFAGCKALNALDISGFNTSKVTDMSGMFSNCTSLASLDVSSLDTSKVTDMSGMFRNCPIQTLELSNFETSQVTNASSMFDGCTSLASLGISHFDTSSASNMANMFWNCSSLRSVALGDKFSFRGAKNARQCSLPKLKGDGLTGFWENVETHELYAEDEIPNNVAATYVAQVKSEVPKTSISESMFAVDTRAKTYTGSPIKPSVSSDTLNKGTDYDVSYGENMNAGEGTVVITGVGDYVGQVTYSFRIDPRQVGAPEAATGLVCSGAEQVGVAPSDDYEVAGGSATNAGDYEAAASLKDKKNYVWAGKGGADDLKISWSIAKAVLVSSMVSGVPSSMEATGSQLTPEPIVTFNGKALVQGADYSLSYGENVSPGKGSVTVTAIGGGNFTGSATVEFDIEKKAEPAPEPQQFAVIYHLDGGANATDNPATYMAGTAVPLADPTKEGFEFQGWYADAEFTVRVTEIPADASGDVELWAKWKEHKPAPAFTDVDYSDSSWYGDAVSYVAERGLITGYSGTTLFGVGDVLTRAQLATILWRNACPDEYASYDPETAVDTTGIDGSADGMYYTAAANWAVKNGVITGFDREDGSKDFAADDDVSFEQLVTILSRLCATPEELSAAGSDLSAFADGDLASSWSRGAFAWAAAKGLVQGYDEPTGRYLRPGDPVARERVAVVLMRAFEMGIMK